ncbi:super-infection exclusion protein B [Echinimonas agarilytica]|uniref:Superinfection exclusion B family protein n=1 Tax=Echinimonas agarilytica TaxID=1215918 RepID=A0AA41WAQ2_9GAMM|nr:super-infection exclusion protein B [Echinimonas agarilytica]MCM2681362.1 superinfection exclusion B family protein [Echinimonas agarilytica]
MNVTEYKSDAKRDRLHRFLLVSLIASGVLLFAPNHIMLKLRLAEILDSYGALVALIYIVTLSYFVVLALNLMARVVMQRLNRQKAQKQAALKANCLDNEERAILREFFLQRTSSLILPIEQEAVQRLTDAHILHRHTQEEGLRTGFYRFSISTEARSYITSKNLRLPVNDLTEDDIRYFKAARPTYVKEQLKQQWREQIRAQRRQAA